MPWNPADAARHTKKAKPGKSSRQWSDVANSVLERTGDEGAAVRQANGVVAKRGKKKAAKKKGRAHGHAKKGSLAQAQRPRAMY